MKSRKWENYIHRNKSDGDCQLVSAANAYYYLTGKIIDDKLYESLIDECGCRCGACINIKKAYDRIGLYVKNSYNYFVSGNMKVLPLEINVWHKFFGYHSIIALDWESKTDAFRITNFRHVASASGWVFSEDLDHFVINNPDKEHPRWKVRTLGIL
jgi:hypothetical protein